MDTPTLAYTGNIKPIHHIEFDVLGGEEIKNRSALGRDNPGIEFADLYENNEPKKGGLADPRLGSNSNDVICPTCNFTLVHCPGHEGHMDLAEPFFHIGFFQHIKKILDCICLECSKLLIHKYENKVKDTIKNKFGKARLQEVYNITKNINSCNSCGSQVSKIRVEFKKTTATIAVYSEINLENIKDESFMIDGKKKISIQLTPKVIYEKLQSISDDDCIILGLDPKRTRPENMIHTTFLIPPVSIRPSARGDFGGGALREDDLTHRLVEIVKSNYRLLKQKENGIASLSKYSKDHSNLVQIHIASYFDADKISNPKNNTKNVKKSLAPSIKSKEGLFRGHIMGKRTDFTARTVITSDPAIDNNQLGIPIKVAMNITFPETVRPDNIEYLTKLVRKGRNSYPGANFVFQLSKAKPGDTVYPIDLRFRKEQVELKYGDIVERHLQTGDPVLLNRQPTLHKQSMMCHRIKVINDESLMTFRLSVATTKPYNADFDGDEMNIFVPQSIQSQIELEEIADVKRQIISPSSSRTSIGIVQDGLIGAYTLTADDMRIDWRNTMNILAYTSFDQYKKLLKNKQYTGHDLFSSLLPPNINISKGDIKIKNSQMISGRLSKEVLGEKKTLAVHQLIWDEYGADETNKYINNIQKLINNFNLFEGFSVGYGDAIIDDKVRVEIDKLFATKEQKVNLMITEMENNPDLMEKDVFEFKLCQEINSILTDVTKLVMASLSPINNFNIMVTTGSNGNTSNIGQISGSLGLQNVEGTIVSKKYNNRTLAYFHQNDDRGKSRGLVRECFLEGLNFTSYTYLMMAGRDGLIDQAIKTADSGYAQRRLIKCLEDIMIKYDCSVRSANEKLLQLVYGDSGSDSTKQYEYHFKIATLSDDELKTKYIFDDNEIKNFKNFKNNENLFELLKSMRDEFRYLMKKSRCDFKTLITKVSFPFNLNRILENITNSDQYKDSSVLEPQYVCDTIEAILDNRVTTLMCMTKSEQENINSVKNKDERVFKTFFRMALYDALSPKLCILQRNLCKKQFDQIIDELTYSYNKSIVQPGEMTGILCAQSMGEPLTQMSMIYDTPIKIYNENQIIIFDNMMGLFCDNVIKDLILFYEYNHIVVDVIDRNYYIQSVNSHGNVELSKISKISRHPCNGGLVRMTTNLNNVVTGTLSHSFLIYENNMIRPIKGSELKLNMLIPSFNPIIDNCDFEIIQKLELLSESDEYVYDFTVPGTETFLADNIFVHNTLNSFHLAGLSTVSTTTHGYARVKELLSVSKNIKTPQMIIQMSPEYVNNKEMAQRIASSIKYTTIKDIRGRINIYYDPFPEKDTDSLMKSDNVKHVYFNSKTTKIGCQGDINNLPWLMRIEIIKEKMIELDISLLDIKSKFCNWWSKRYADSKNMKKEERRVINRISSIAVLSNSDNDQQPIIHIRFNVKDVDKNKDSFNRELLNDFIDHIIDVFNIKGLIGINSVMNPTPERMIAYDDKTKAIKKDIEEYCIYTNGINILDIRYITGIDLDNTVCNDLVEVYNTYGIEIARTRLMRELYDAYDRAGHAVTYSNLSIIVDMMTSSGVILSIDRHGMSKSDTDVLGRASFEKPDEHLISASVFGEVDLMRGVSSRISTGLVIKGGTGFCDIALDINMLEKSEYTDDSSKYRQFTEVSTDTVANDVLNNPTVESTDIFIPM
jgi:DNA-directed RNA polymerase II subunit RPB1